MTTRRDFLATTMTAAAAFAAAPAARAAWLRAQVPGLRYGMVTYLWGRDLRLGALLAACAEAGLEAVELRTTHAHGVEPAQHAFELVPTGHLMELGPIERVEADVHAS